MAVQQRYTLKPQKHFGYLLPILEVLMSGSSETPVSIYQIHKHKGTPSNFRTLHQILDLLSKNGLVENSRENYFGRVRQCVKYRITPKGKILYHELQRVHRFLDDTDLYRHII